MHHTITEKIAIIGHPSDPSAARWEGAAMVRLRELGFTGIQVNIGWGARPGDEPLSLEDVVELSPEDERRLPQPVKLNSNPSRRDQRRSELAERVAMARAAGFRTAFNCGIPFNNHTAHPDPQPNCILDPDVSERYWLLLGVFASEFEVDDLWLYTYDQDAWLCSEFGACPRCVGVPLHRRLTPFLEQIIARWQELRPGGRVCWEPWELSAGQILQVVEQIETRGLALALHNNSAETMVALPADRHVRNLARAAAERGVPVILEGFFGATSEEVEPFVSLQSPLTTYRQVREMIQVPGVTGLKEYYGLDLRGEDPNLRAAALCWRDPTLADDVVLAALSEGYGDADVRRTVEEVWRLASEAMELYPWDASWFVREVGRSNPAHSLTAAAMRGFCAETPAWLSTRATTFMVIEDMESHPWFLEDLELRWRSCADRQRQAILLAETVQDELGGPEGEAFRAFVIELREFHRRVLAYVYHCRETNLSRLLLAAMEAGHEAPAGVVEELASVLTADAEIRGNDDLDEPIALLGTDPAAFARRYFRPVPVEEVDQDVNGSTLTERRFPWPLGPFSATSR